jgi:hypothetical protein
VLLSVAVPRTKNARAHLTRGRRGHVIVRGARRGPGRRSRQRARSLVDGENVEGEGAFGRRREVERHRAPIRSMVAKKGRRCRARATEARAISRPCDSPWLRPPRGAARARASPRRGLMALAFRSGCSLMMAPRARLCSGRAGVAAPKEEEEEAVAVVGRAMLEGATRGVLSTIRGRGSGARLSGFERRARRRAASATGHAAAAASRAPPPPPCSARPSKSEGRLLPLAPLVSLQAHHRNHNIPPIARIQSPSAYDTLKAAHRGTHTPPLSLHKKTSGRAKRDAVRPARRRLGAAAATSAAAAVARQPPGAEFGIELMSRSIGGVERGSGSVWGEEPPRPSSPPACPFLPAADGFWSAPGWFLGSSTAPWALSGRAPALARARVRGSRLDRALLRIGAPLLAHSSCPPRTPRPSIAHHRSAMR